MKPVDLFVILIVWVLPCVMAVRFESLYPLFGWAGSTLVSYFIVAYEDNN